MFRPLRELSKGLTSRRASYIVSCTIPTREFAKPLSMARSNGTPRPTSFSLNQTETPCDSSRSCSSLAASFRSSHAWQRKTSRRSGRFVRFSTLLRTGVSARTCSGVYNMDEPAFDQFGFDLRTEPPLHAGQLAAALAELCPLTGAPCFYLPN